MTHIFRPSTSKLVLLVVVLCVPIGSGSVQVQIRFSSGSDQVQVQVQIRFRLRSGSGSDQVQVQIRFRLRSGSGSDQVQVQIRFRFRFIMELIFTKSDWISCLFTFLLPGTKHLPDLMFVLTGIIKPILWKSVQIWLSKHKTSSQNSKNWADCIKISSIRYLNLNLKLRGHMLCWALRIVSHVVHVLLVQAQVCTTTQGSVSGVCLPSAGLLCILCRSQECLFSEWKQKTISEFLQVTGMFVFWIKKQFLNFCRSQECLLSE